MTLLRRLLLLVAVALMMVAILVVMAVPAFAQGRSQVAPNCEKGNETAASSKGADNRNAQAARSLDKNFFGDGKNPNAAHCLEAT